EHYSATATGGWWACGAGRTGGPPLRRDWRQRHALFGRRWRRRAEQPAKLLALHHLNLQQAAGDRLELVAAIGENRTGRVVRLGQDARDLGVDLLRGVFSVQPPFGRQRDVQEARALLPVVVD